MTSANSVRQRQWSFFLLKCRRQQSPLLTCYSLTMLARSVQSLSHRAVRPMIARTSAAAASSRRAWFSSSSSDNSKTKQPLDYPVIPSLDFGAFREYSVIHTDRSLNLMSDPFQRVMRDLNDLLKVTYNADKVAIIPGCVQSRSFFSLSKDHRSCSFSRRLSSH